MAKKAEGKKTWSRAELERIRMLIEDLYINRGFSTEKIVAEWDVSAQTLVKWKKGRTGEKSWDERKVFNELTPVKLREVLLEEALKIAQGNEPALKADALSKVMSAIDKLDSTVNPRVIASVFISFNNWFVDIDPVMANEFTKFQRMFLQHSISNYQ
jgi:transposase